MRGFSLVMACGFGAIAAGCGRERRPEAATADSIRMADSVAMAPGGRKMAGNVAKAPAPRTENVVTVTEQVPGLLAQAKYNSLDAQHIAQTKFPFGVVQDGTIGRRGGDLVYTFHIRDDSTGMVHAVLVNAIDGKLITSIPEETAKKKPPK